MDKKDILEKAQKENKYGDERYNRIYLQGAQIGMSVGIALCGIAVMLDTIINSGMSWLSIFIMLIQCAMNGTMYTVLAIQCRKRRDIILAICFGVVCIAFIVLLIIYFAMGNLV